jgi:hypothetical protein
MALGVALTMTVALRPCPAEDKPTGAPLELSTVETEQAIPLTYVDPDGKGVHCASVKLHWNPNSNVGPNDDSTSFETDMTADNPSAPIFTAQLWKASLASALAWQEPWHGARWKIMQAPTTDGTGINAALAVGMISTSARRPYPPKTVVIGGLNPDGSLGGVSHLSERIHAAADAGMTKVIIPSVQRFDTDASGQVINMVRTAGDLHLECVPVDNLVEATQAVMNDPLPDLVPAATSPKYNNEVASYIEEFAHREQNEVGFNMKFAPKQDTLSKYPAHLAAIWKSVYADEAAGQQAYSAGQVYVAYRLFAHANASMNGVNALTGQNRANFDVKAALADSDDLRNKLHTLMNPPAIDKGELQSAVLVAEMADWAYGINASLEGAQLVTKQTFSKRTDATDAEKDRAREAILFAIEQGKYLLGQAEFFNGLLPRIGNDNPIPVDENAEHLLPQLIPAQLATAQIFTDGIRQHANELRDGLLFDPDLVAYVGVLRETQTDWIARQRKKEIDAQAAATAAAASPTPTPTGTDSKSGDGKNTDVKSAVKLNSNGAGAPVFDPGDTFKPPHTELAPTLAAKKISDASLCLIWVNNDCEIATLDEKYLRLNGAVDPATHEWHVADRAKLDSLLQSAEAGARQGIAFAQKAEIDPSVLAMIYERGSYLRIQTDDASALEALRQYWRCALLGNMCWQLAHTHKAQAVDLTKEDGAPDDKTAGKDDKTASKDKDKDADKSKPVEAAASDKDKGDKGAATTKAQDKSAPASTNSEVVVAPPLPPVAPPATNEVETPAPPRALPVVEEVAPNPPAPPTPAPAPTPTPAPSATAENPPAPINEDNIPVAHVAKMEDYGPVGTSPVAAPVTNAPPQTPQPPRSDNADGHANAFP